MSSSSGGGNYSKSTSSPYQSQLYDSWKTEWNAPTFSYDQYNRSGGGMSSGDDDRYHRNDDRYERGRSQTNGRQSASSYMTKGKSQWSRLLKMLCIIMLSKYPYLHLFSYYIFRWTKAFIRRWLLNNLKCNLPRKNPSI